MILLFGMISFVTNLASPMGDVLKNQFDKYILDWMGTLGVFANFIAYAFMGIPAGNLLQKRGYKFTALAAVAVGFTGVGIQAIAGTLNGSIAFSVYLLGAFIAGVSMCMLNIVVNPMLNKLAGGGNRGNQLLQLGGSFNSLMGTAVIALVGILIPSMVKAEIPDVYPLMFTALIIFAVAFIVILFTKIPENENVGKAKQDNSKIGPMSFRHFVLGAIGIFIYVGVEVGIPKVLQSWLNVHLEQKQEIVAENDGVIKEILVKQKYEVKEGDVLARIEVVDEDGKKIIDLTAPNKAVITEVIDIEKDGPELKAGDTIITSDTAFAGTIAGTVAATYWLLMLVGRLLGAALGARISSKKMLTAVSCLGIVLVSVLRLCKRNRGSTLVGMNTLAHNYLRHTVVFGV
jgi:fucose permease